MQEVNQSVNAKRVECISNSRFDYPITEDNHAYNTVKMLQNKGLCYDWCHINIKCGYEKYDEGLSLLSLFPIVDAQEIRISSTSDYYNWKKRSALVIKTECDELGFIANTHMGWWDDADESFYDQWKRLSSALPNGRGFLMGDFNSDAEIKNEGYDMVKKSGWYDTYSLAKTKEKCYTVKGKIDGWKSHRAKRIDYIFANVPHKVKTSSICFDKNVISDHFGVLAELDIQEIKHV